MAIRTKTYIAFDGDSDLMSYRTIQRWSKDEGVTVNLNDAHNVNTANDDSLPESIIRQLKERLDSSKLLLLLVGDKTKYNRKGILKYELNYALRNRLPIGLIFIGFSADHNNTSDLWKKYLHPKLPTIITQAEELYAYVSPFTQKAVEFLIENVSHTNLPNTGYTWNWR